MKIYLAGVAPWRGGGLYDEAIHVYHPYILESFYYSDADTEKLIPYFGDFLLDSGAYTFMQNAKKQIVWDEYVEKYADFINRNNINKFFELDIDGIVGLSRVLEFRKKLERLTGKQPIPVWHNSRGKDNWIGTAKDYPYVAIGGLVSEGTSGEYARKLQPYFRWFIDTAHENGAKIHALGFTSVSALEKYHFDSVDSTAWTAGNRFGYVYRFDGKRMQKIDAPKGKRLRDSRQIALVNYCEWIKYQKYAEVHL